MLIEKFCRTKKIKIQENKVYKLVVRGTFDPNKSIHAEQTGRMASILKLVIICHPIAMTH